MLKTIPKACFIDNKYCPGCGHGIANRLVAEVLEEMGRDGDALAAIAVGCASLMPDTFGIDCVQAQHGRAAAVAVGMKLVFTYQGDGDALAIGFSETMYAAVRHENITVIFVNNGNFGMTGGQMAPTTLEGQRTTTSPRGRDVRTTGDPMNIMELLKPLDPAYLARGSMTSSAEILKTKKYIRTAFEAQERGMGYSFVEILSPCPTNWGLSAMDAVARIRAEVVPVYPLGEFVKKEGL